MNSRVSGQCWYTIQHLSQLKHQRLQTILSIILKHVQWEKVGKRSKCGNKFWVGTDKVTEKSKEKLIDL